MPEEKTYTVELTETEMNELLESLRNLRKYYAESPNAIENPLFVAASKLHYKIAKVYQPESDVTIENYLTLGRD